MFGGVYNERFYDEDSDSDCFSSNFPWYYREEHEEYDSAFDGDELCGRIHHDGPRYCDLAPVSKAALRREAQAKETFLEVKRDFEKHPVKDKVTTLHLLQPSCHLTSYTWGSFRKFVISHPGWTVKRRVATSEEKTKAHQTRRGKVYFVDTAFSPPKKALRTPPRATSKRAAAKMGLNTKLPARPFKKAKDMNSLVMH